MEAAICETAIGNALAAGQDPASIAQLDSIVTAVRMLSESLLANRVVSREVQQKVKALAAHMEILATRHRLAASKSCSPSVSETRLALRNLKQFLERESVRKKAKKTPSASCTTDTLDSSCSHVQALTPRSGRRRSLCSPSVYARIEVPPLDARASRAVACGSKGDTELQQQQRRRNPDRAKAKFVTPDRELRFRCLRDGDYEEAVAQLSQMRLRPLQKPRQSNALWEPKRPPKPLPSESLSPDELRQRLHSPAQQVQLTCSEWLPLLLLPMDRLAGAGTGGDSRLLAATESASPLPSRLPVEASACECRLVPAGECAGRLLHCRSAAHVQLAPRVAANRQLAAPDVAVERTLDLPALTAEPKWVGSASCHSRNGTAAVADVVAEQDKFNCASVSTRVLTWANPATIAEATTAVDAATNKSLSKSPGESREEALAAKGDSQQLQSTCSCPSESDVARAGPSKDDAALKKDTDENVVIQASSTSCRPEEAPHAGIEAAPIQLLQRVCESCSTEMLAPSSTGILALGHDPPESQQPLLRVEDLLRLVQLAEPLARSGRPTEALEVTVGRSSSIEAAADTSVASSQPTEAAAAACDLQSARSPFTLDVVDHCDPAAKDAQLTAAAAKEAAGATLEPEPAPQGHTWSSCEVGQSSGFTKLLLTLNRRRQEQQASRVKQQQPQQPQPDSGSLSVNGSVSVAGSGTTARGRKTTQSGCGGGSGSVWSCTDTYDKTASQAATSETPSKRRPRHRSPPPQPQTRQRCSSNSSGVHPPAAAQPQPPATFASTTDDAEARRRQEEALKLAATSLAGLARSLQLCVLRVNEAADAINTSLGK